MVVTAYTVLIVHQDVPSLNIAQRYCMRSRTQKFGDLSFNISLYIVQTNKVYHLTSVT